MKQYTFPYGDGQVSLELDERQVLGVLRGQSLPEAALNGSRRSAARLS